MGTDKSWCRGTDQQSKGGREAPYSRPRASRPHSAYFPSFRTMPRATSRTSSGVACIGLHRVLADCLMTRAARSINACRTASCTGAFSTLGARRASSVTMARSRCTIETTCATRSALSRVRRLICSRGIALRAMGSSAAGVRYSSGFIGPSVYRDSITRFAVAPPCGLDFASDCHKMMCAHTPLRARLYVTGATRVIRGC